MYVRGLCLGTIPDAQELLLDNVMAAAKKMAAAQTTGNVHEFNNDVTTMNSGMTELESTLAAAQCPPTRGGQAALNMCLIKQQLGRAASLKQGVTNAKVSRTSRTVPASRNVLGLLEKSTIKIRDPPFICKQLSSVVMRIDAHRNLPTGAGGAAIGP